jgi:hypothetical protein
MNEFNQVFKTVENRRLINNFFKKIHLQFDTNKVFKKVLECNESDTKEKVYNEILETVDDLKKSNANTLHKLRSLLILKKAIEVKTVTKELSNG